MNYKRSTKTKYEPVGYEVASATGPKMYTPVKAPSFPMAADSPLKVARVFFEKVCAGRTNVVKFGPNESEKSRKQ